jgi:hypothetical protein
LDPIFDSGILSAIQPVFLPEVAGKRTVEPEGWQQAASEEIWSGQPVAAQMLDHGQTCFTQEHTSKGMCSPLSPSRWELPPIPSRGYVPRISVEKLLDDSQSLSEELKPIFDKWLGKRTAKSEDAIGEISFSRFKNKLKPYKINNGSPVLQISS